MEFSRFGATGTIGSTDSQTAITFDDIQCLGFYRNSRFQFWTRVNIASKRFLKGKKMPDTRSQSLGLVEAYLRSQNPDIPNVRLIAQAHYGSPGYAFIVVSGVGDNTPRRRAIRSMASDLLQRMGHQVELEPGRDVFEIDAVRPRSRHEELAMLATMQKVVQKS